LLVYNPVDAQVAKVYFIKGETELNDGEPIEIKDFSKFFNWEIADFDVNEFNDYSVYTIGFDGKRVDRSLSFLVTTDPNRKMEIMRQASL
jgi:hypothetical protein